MITATETDWLSAYRAGNNDVLGLLLEKYSSALILVANKYVKDISKAQDIVQDAVMQLLKRSLIERKGRPPAGVSLKSHIFKMVQGKSIDHYRRESKREEIHRFWADIYFQGSIHSDTEKNELPLHILAGIDLKLCQLILDNYSTDEICEQLELDRNQYRVIRQRAVRKLKREIRFSQPSSAKTNRP